MENKNGWDDYKWATGSGKEIREVGDIVIKELLKIEDEKDNISIRISENAGLFVGLPYYRNAFRALMSYIARWATSHRRCFIVSPVIQYTGSTYELEIIDIEMALIPIK